MNYNTAVVTACQACGLVRTALDPTKMITTILDSVSRIETLLRLLYDLQVYNCSDSLWTGFKFIGMSDYPFQ